MFTRNRSLFILVVSFLSLYASDAHASLLHNASYNGYKNVVKLLLKGGSKIDQFDKFGDQAIHFAACNGQIKVLKVLLSNGADINAIGHEGNTSLHYAALNGKIDVLEYLLKQGADLNIVDSFGFTPWHKADAYASMYEGPPKYEAKKRQKNRLLMIDLLKQYGATFPYRTIRHES